MNRTLLFGTLAAITTATAHAGRSAGVSIDISQPGVYGAASTSVTGRFPRTCTRSRSSLRPTQSQW